MERVTSKKGKNKPSSCIQKVAWYLQGSLVILLWNINNPVENQLQKAQSKTMISGGQTRPLHNFF